MEHLFASPVGTICLKGNGTYITSLDITGGGPTASHPSESWEVFFMAEAQLSQYFDGRRRKFDLPLDFHGTPFETAVLQALLTVPYGQTVSYGELAGLIGYPRGARAVGQALNRNPLPILIPCHRVVAKNGIGGYAYGAEAKAFLLELEARHR